MPQEEGTKTPVKTFKAYASGFVHVDAGPGSNAATCSLPLIGRCAGFTWRSLRTKSATAASDFLARLIDKAPYDQQGAHRQRQGIY